MSFLKTLGLGAYYRIRRVTKALRNWRKFGVIIFGSLFVAASLMPLQLMAQGEFLRVVVSPTTSTIDLGESESFHVTVKLNGSPTTPDTIKWFVGDIQQYAYDNQINMSYAPVSAGTYGIRVIATAGAVSGQSTATLTVLDNLPPDPDPDPDPSFLRTVISPTTSTIKLGQSENFNLTTKLDGIAIHPDTIKWYVNGVLQSAYTNGSYLYLSPGAVGTYNIRALVTEGDSAPAQSYATLCVIPNLPPPPVNQPPIAEIVPSPSSGYSPLFVTLNAGGSYDPDHPNGWIVSYEWDWEGDGVYDVVTGAAAISHTYSASGIFHPAVRVTDNEGDTDTAFTTVVVSQAPEPIVCSYIDISTNNPYLYVGDTANVDLEARDNQGGYLGYADLQWSWNLGWFDVYGDNLYHATEVGTGTLTARCPGNPSVYDSITFNVQDIWVQQEYLAGVDGWAGDHTLYGFDSTSLSSYAWSNLHSPLSGASYYWEKLNGVGYLSGDVYSQNGARFNSNNVNGSATLRVTASWGGASVSDTVVVYTHDNIVPPPNTPIYTSFVGIVEGGGTACDNDVIQFTIKLGNFGQNLISGVQLTMGIPDYTTFLSASSTTDHPRLSGGQIVWDAGTLYTNDIETLIVRVILNDDIPAVGIQGSAYVTSDQNPGFTVKSNIIYTCGATGGSTQPLTPTGINWQILALLAAISLGLTAATYRYFIYRIDRQQYI